MGVPGEQEQRVINALKNDIEAREGHLDTGIFGTQFFFEVLADYGMQDLAYQAMNKTTQPSFGWWVANGNTTSWKDGRDPLR
jgi:alpha-L-rhamnosidase